MSAGISNRLNFHGRESSKILSAISGSNYPTSEEYPLTAANFPGLLEAFTADGISGNNLVGRLGTVTITCSTGWTQPAAGQFRPATSAALTTSGAWTAINTRHAVFLVVGKLNTGTVNTALGNTLAGSSMGIQPSQGAVVRVSGSHLAFSLTDFTGVSYPIDGVAIVLDQSTANGGANKFAVDGATDLSSSPFTVLGDISASWNGFNVGANCAVLTSDTNSYYTGIYMVATTWLPTAQFIYDALRWMVAHPKFLYPGFYHNP